MYKIINWYTKRFRFPRRGWKIFRSLLQSKGLYQHSFCKKLHNDTFMWVRPSEHIQQQLLWHGYYEKDAILTWEKMATKNDIVLDIGANTGYYSIIAAPKVKKIYAFEPATATVDQLKNNIQLNQFKNVEVMQVAISDQPGTKPIYLSSSENSGMTGLATSAYATGKTELITVTTLDEWMRTHQPSSVNLIKIDVEGSEMNVLTGAADFFKQHQPVVFIEIINKLLARFDYNADDIFEFFSRHHYKGYEIISPAVLSPLQQSKEAYNIVFLPANFNSFPGIKIISNKN